MIQEILDYLWIRNILLFQEEEIIEDYISKKNKYSDYIQILSRLMQREDLAVVYPEIQDKISKTVNKYRFEYNTAEINEDINYIVGRLNDYKKMSDTRQKQIIGEFYADEIVDRNMPIIYKNCKEELTTLIGNDFNCFISMYKASDEETGEDIETTFQPDMLQYTSLVNILINRFPEFFEEKAFVDVTIMNFMRIKETPKLKGSMYRYVKRTLKELVRIKEEQEAKKRLEK